MDIACPVLVHKTYEIIKAVFLLATDQRTVEIKY